MHKIKIIIPIFLSLYLLPYGKVQAQTTAYTPKVETVGFSNVSCNTFSMHGKITKDSGTPPFEAGFLVRMEGNNLWYNGGIFSIFRVGTAQINQTHNNSSYYTVKFSTSTLSGINRICFLAESSAVSGNPAVLASRGNFMCFYPWMWQTCPSPGQLCPFDTKFNCPGEVSSSPPNLPSCNYDGVCTGSEQASCNDCIGECYRGVVIHYGSNGKQWIAGFDRTRNPNGMVVFENVPVRGIFPSNQAARHFIDYYYAVYGGDSMPFDQCLCPSGSACPNSTLYPACRLDPLSLCEYFENPDVCPAECKKTEHCYRGVRVNLSYSAEAQSSVWIEGIAHNGIQGFNSLDDAKNYIDSVYEQELGPVSQCDSPNGKYIECYNGFYIYIEHGYYPNSQIVYTDNYFNCSLWLTPSCILSTIKKFNSLQEARADIDYIRTFASPQAVKSKLQCGLEMPAPPYAPCVPDGVCNGEDPIECDDCKNPPKSVLTVETIDALDIKSDAATLKGKIITMGGASQVKYWFKYGKTQIEDKTWEIVPVPEFTKTSNSGFDFELKLTGLSPQTVYYFKAYAQGLDGEGADKQIRPPRNGQKRFTTLKDPNACKNENIQITEPANLAEIDSLSLTARWTKPACVTNFTYSLEDTSIFDFKSTTLNQASLSLPKWDTWYTLKVIGCTDNTYTVCTPPAQVSFKTKKAPSVSCRRQYIGSRINYNGSDLKYKDIIFLGACKNGICRDSYANFFGTSVDIFREFVPIGGPVASQITLYSDGRKKDILNGKVYEWEDITLAFNYPQTGIKVIDSTRPLSPATNVNLVVNAREKYALLQNITPTISSPEVKNIKGKVFNVLPSPNVGIAADDPVATPGKITIEPNPDFLVYSDSDTGQWHIKPIQEGVSSLTISIENLDSYQTLNNEYFNSGCIEGGSKTFNLTVLKNGYPKIISGPQVLKADCKKIEFSVEASDPDNDKIFYDWRCPPELGSFAMPGGATVKNPVFNLNANLLSNNFKCFVRVYDEHGAFHLTESIKEVEVSVPQCTELDIVSWNISPGDLCAEKFTLFTDWTLKQQVSGSKILELKLKKNPLDAQYYANAQINVSGNNAAWECGEICYNSSGKAWAEITLYANGFPSKSVSGKWVIVPTHIPPRPYFIIEAKNALAGEYKFYGNADNVLSFPVTNWSWYFQSEEYPDNKALWPAPDSRQKNPEYKYSDTKEHKVTLVITDLAGMICSTSTDFDSGSGTIWTEPTVPY